MLPQERFPGSLFARPGLASIKKVRKFQLPSGRELKFQQRPRGPEVSPSASPSASLRISKDSSLAFRFGWFRPISGHPSSLVGLRSVTASTIFDCSCVNGVAKNARICGDGASFSQELRCAHALETKLASLQSQTLHGFGFRGSARRRSAVSHRDR